MRESRHWLGLAFATVAVAAIAGGMAPAHAQGAGGAVIGTNVGGYVLAPGDVVAVTVLLEEELTGKYRIGDTGTISMLMPGVVQAAGFTTDQLAIEITNGLRAYIKRPVVQVNVDAEASVRQVAVSGYVAKPGLVAVPFGGSLAAAVLSAGITPQSDLSQVRVTRAGQPAFVLDLGGIRGGDMGGAAMPSRNGDLVWVPKRADADFSVLGMVMEPGVKLLDPEEADRLDVLRALNAAGGVREGADLSEATILRKDGQKETVNLHALLREGDLSQNKPMALGDTLIVRAADRITVAGEVTEPTSFLAPEPMKLLEVIAQAKGLTPNADMKNATVVQPEGPLVVDLEKLWGQGDLTQNVDVRPGETVIVPTRDPEEVLVLGAVLTPGSVDIHRTRDHGILRVVGTAVPKPTADLRRIVVHRLGAPEPLIVDLKSVTDQGARQANIDVQGGDLIFVPEMQKVYAVGGFNTPGMVALTDQMTVTELVAMAGGFRSDALPGRMQLLRAVPGSAEPQITKINFGRIEKGMATAKIPLVEGDILYVPSRDPSRRGWEWWRDLLWSIAGFTSIFR
jgi:protein involved in polysaccharide export with SLBB domain